MGLDGPGVRASEGQDVGVYGDGFGMGSLAGIRACPNPVRNSTAKPNLYILTVCPSLALLPTSNHLLPT